jgi:hypothetical protein
VRDPIPDEKFCHIDSDEVDRKRETINTEQRGEREMFVNVSRLVALFECWLKGERSSTRAIFNAQLHL